MAVTQGQIERVPKDILEKVSHAICQSASIFFGGGGGSQFLVGVLKCINTRSNRKGT